MSEKKNLNYTYYTGIDLYTEGEVEDEILNIVSNNSSDIYDSIIYEKKSWSYLYHLSSLRANIINWYPMNKSQSVLEIGAGCGAISGALAHKCGSLCCIDLSKKRSLINSIRNKNYDNIEIIVGNYEDIEPNLNKYFDIITLIGVLEYSASYISGEQPFHTMINRALKHLDKNGKILVAIENRLGLKYWAGCKEDHVSKYFEGIEGYSRTEGVRTFTKKELEKILNECNVKYKFYYPYPDYKFMVDIFTDDHLPSRGQLNNNIRNFDQERFFLFDESKVFDTLIDNDLFQNFSNSFFVEIWKDENHDY